MKRVFLILAVLSLSGCSHHSKDRYGTRSGGLLDEVSGATDYESTFERNTRHEKIHSEFEGVLTAHITEWNNEVREAYVRDMKSQFRLSPDDEKNLAQEQLMEDEAYFVFIVSVATREPAWNDINQKRSAWRVTLENEDASTQLDPERIEKVSEHDQRAKYFYRYMDAFSYTYKIRFPRNLMRKEPAVVLHITGPRGAVSAKFKNKHASTE